MAVHGNGTIHNAEEPPQDKLVLDIPQKVDEAVEDGSRKPRLPASVTSFFQDYWHNCKQRPMFMLLLPLLTFCVLCSLSVLGVVLGADKYENDQRNSAESTAVDWAASFRLSTEKIFTPLVTLAIFIQQNPDLASFRGAFPVISKQLLEEVNKERTVIQELQVSPMGIIELIQPNNSDTAARLGINIFQEPALRGGALATIQAREVMMNGPLDLVQGNFGTVSRIPIFVQNATLNETFGTGTALPYNCIDLCFNQTTKEKFWGFATAVGPLDDLRAGNDSMLEPLRDKGYLWLMTRPYTATERGNNALYRPEWTDRFDQYIFANSSRWPSNNAVASDIYIGNAVWRVYLEPEAGWRPGWERGATAAVVLGSLILALLVAIIMALWAQQHRLLGDVMDRNQQLADTTAKLQQEKLRLDALLVRQYNLLALLGKSGGRSGGRNDGSGGSPDTSADSSKEGLTLERIESMRRQLAVNSNSSTQDLESIQTTELLGEGTFGKVYKGLWRGTVVAVKTMLLPANMSGAEKREKMAVMEAAISSSLCHPNIVQTYTYAIRPMRESNSNQTLGEIMSEQPSSNGTSLNKSTSSTSAGVHSYEVRLVLEYCDKGCLRDALDDGCFRLGDGVNYLAILDTAADVAKAMLHLHSCNVLHSDLKARNVMLSTGNADGRGIVGKVGDFGLSLKMDHLETHISQVYQGTMTHMAPEIMLDGRVSKAADVYAFGITLWEMYTSGRAFEGVPRALLGHHITREHKRPRFPDSTPWAYRELAERCWQPNWDARPTFQQVLQDLLAMRAADPAPTPQMQVKWHRPRPRTHSQAVAVAAALKAPSNSSSPNSSGNHGPAGTTSSPPITPSLPKVLPHNQVVPSGDGERSYYLEHSVDDSDLLVMRSLTDWSLGASGTNQGFNQTGAERRRGSTARMGRSLLMPQIVEVAGEHEGQDDGHIAAAAAAAAQQQLQQFEGQF